MKTLHTATAVIELGAGLALLCFPSTTVALLLGLPLDTPSIPFLSLFVVCWLT
jgi:hypothetical protein